MEFGKHLGKGIWGLADKLLPVVYGLAYVLLVIRVLPEEEFGYFVLVQEIFLIITGLATALALQPLLKFAAEESCDMRGSVSAAVHMSAAFYLVSSIAIVVFSSEISMLLRSPGLAPLLFYLPMMFLAAFIRNLALILLQSKFMIKEVFWTDAFHFVGTPLLIWLVSRLHFFDSAYDLILINIGSLTASSLVGLVLAKPLLRFQFRPNAHEVVKLWNYGRWVVGGTVSGFAVSKADTFILAALAGPVQVAVYGSVKVFVRVYEMITQVIQMFVLPAASKLLSKGDSRSLKAMVEKATMFSTLGMIPVFLSFLLLASFWVAILYRGRYSDAVPMLQVFALAALAVPTSAVAGNVLMGLGHAKAVFVVGVQMLVVALIAYISLIPFFGGTGAAVGYTMTTYASAFFASWYLRKHIPMKLTEVLRRTNDVIVFVKTRLGF
ncbi:MAG: oligosaccharide flippase family protein [Ignavibacteriae bacterium]|nr:oligosaccharide flippase family protein [Ignavibacteriota bacterium]